MYPLDRFYDDTDRPIPHNRGREQHEISRKHYRSKGRDRSFVRRALRRGVPAQEIEDRLLAATEFHRLNPDCDPITYVRGLIDEEGGALRILDVAATPAGDSPVGPNSVIAAGNDQAMQSEAMARRYIQENFEATDWLAVVVRNRESGETIQRIATAQQIVSHEFQSWLRFKNAHGSDVYLSLNPLSEHAHGRTKADVKEIRHLYLDLDDGGQQKLAAIYENPAVPHPNYVLQTSRDKYQAIWRVEGIPPREAEELLRRLAQRFGGDRAATDATRVFRLPGFNNKKYEQDFLVKLTAGTLPEPVYHRSDFNIETVPYDGATARPSATVLPSLRTSSADTQSERDWAYAIRRLRRGDQPADIVREMAGYRTKDRYDSQDSRKLTAPKKPNPRYYAEHTVGRAMAYLGMASRPLEKLSDQDKSRSPENDPHR